MRDHLRGTTIRRRAVEAHVIAADVLPTINGASLDACVASPEIHRDESRARDYPATRSRATRTSYVFRWLYAIRSSDSASAACGSRRASRSPIT